MTKQQQDEIVSVPDETIVIAGELYKVLVSSKDNAAYNCNINCSFKTDDCTNVPQCRGEKRSDGVDVYYKHIPKQQPKIPTIAIGSKGWNRWYCCLGENHGCKLNLNGNCTAFMCQYKVQLWTDATVRGGKNDYQSKD